MRTQLSFVKYLLAVLVLGLAPQVVHAQAHKHLRIALVKLEAARDLLPAPDPFEAAARGEINRAISEIEKQFRHLNLWNDSVRAGIQAGICEGEFRNNKYFCAMTYLHQAQQEIRIGEQETPFWKVGANWKDNVAMKAIFEAKNKLYERHKAEAWWRAEWNAWKW